MPTNFTVFNSRNRDANVVYNSGSYTIPVDTTDTRVKLTLTDLDLINEPETTRIYWSIERNGGNGWTHMVSGWFSGRGGETLPKPPGTIATNIDNILGQQVRGSLYFVSDNDQRKRFGVDGETY